MKPGKRRELGSELGIATLPYLEDAEAESTVGSFSPVAINAKSKNNEMAWEFVKFVCGEEGAKIHAEFQAVSALESGGAMKYRCFRS